MKLLFLFLISFTANAHDLWNVKSGNDWILANSTQCVITTYEKEITFMDETPARIEDSRIKFKRTPMTASQKLACEKLMLAAGGKVLKAVPSSNGTRRTRDITATTYTTLRIPDTSSCEGAIIKKYQTNKNWHKVVGLDVTTLCGEYLMFDRTNPAHITALQSEVNTDPITMGYSGVSRNVLRDLLNDPTSNVGNDTGSAPITAESLLFAIFNEAVSSQDQFRLGNLLDQDGDLSDFRAKLIAMGNPIDAAILTITRPLSRAEVLFSQDDANGVKEFVTISKNDLLAAGL